MVILLIHHPLGTKFKVIYNDVETLKKGQVTELPGQISLYSLIPKVFFQAISSRFGIWVDRGDLDLDRETSLNKKLPELKTLKLKEFLEKAWKYERP
jgi:hypothetical protein